MHIPRWRVLSLQALVGACGGYLCCRTERSSIDSPALLWHGTLAMHRLYTKAVPLAEVPLEDVLKLGTRRSVQLPGAVFVTAPGYALHTTLSAGWSLADSANFQMNVRGKVGGRGGSGV